MGQLPDPSPATHTERLPSMEDTQPFPVDDQQRIASVQPWVDQVAARYDMDPDLINAVIWVESRFQPRAKSPAGARGLMQLMPATANAMARKMGRSTARVYEPQFNVEAGSLYLLQMLDRYDGDETLALAAYNAGAGNVGKWMREDGELPPRSLRYVELVQHARVRFIAMRERQQGPGQDDERTMIAAGPAAEPRNDARAKARPEVPPPPRRTRAPKTPTPAADNPLAPDPDVYRPEPTPEPPLADTPYPPPPEPEPETPTDADEPVDIATPQALPSVLD